MSSKGSDSMDEKELLSKLVDKYGFSYATAQEIASQENSSFILSCIANAYQKGRNYDADSWRGTSYG